MGAVQVQCSGMGRTGMRQEPIWNNDGPANLEAAASDALEWLKLFRNFLPVHGRERENNLKRLEACIAALKEQLGQAE